MHGEEPDGSKVVYTATYAAEMAETAEQAEKQFKEKHPGQRVLSVHAATERDKIYGLGYLTDEETEEYKKRIHAMYEKSGSELDEIKERLLEYEPDEFLANVEYQNRRETEETQNAEGVHLGDIFYRSWGYEQTNIDFYQVVALRGKHTIVLRQNEVKDGLSRTSLTGYTRPIRDHFKAGQSDREITVRTRFIDWRGNGDKELKVCVEDDWLRYAEFGKLYDFSAYA